MPPTPPHLVFMHERRDPRLKAMQAGLATQRTSSGNGVAATQS